MYAISNSEFGGERPLFALKDLRMENVTIHAGESALKKCNNIEAIRCVFEGKYPFWHCNGFFLERCVFTSGARAAIWYSKGCNMSHCLVDAPKMFREMTGITVSYTDFPHGEEMLWDCSDVTLRNVSIKECPYLLSHSKNINIDHYYQDGNYSFQYCKNVVVRNAVINSKDAFWNTENVTIIDSEINGEYLGWYSSNLSLINCRISGTQPLCYIKNLKMVNCSMASDSDLGFEESDVEAEISSSIISIKNPASGCIKAQAIGEIILDENLLKHSDCKILTLE